MARKEAVTTTPEDRYIVASQEHDEAWKALNAAYNKKSEKPRVDEKKWAELLKAVDLSTERMFGAYDAMRMAQRQAEIAARAEVNERMIEIQEMVVDTLALAEDVRFNTTTAVLGGRVSKLVIDAVSDFDFGSPPLCLDCANG